MTYVRPIEKTITELEGANNALWNFAHSDELSAEVQVGLQWLAQQMDGLMVELRENWDNANPEKEDKPPLKAVEE